jgi:CheY-like chemotaxis protein
MENELYKQPLIFVVDDDEDDLLFIKAALMNNIPNGTVSCFIHGRHLLNELTRENAPLPSFIIMDLNMPIMNGKDALKQIRTNKALHHIPVVIFSTSNDPNERSQCMASGANNYFCKPSSLNIYDGIVQNLKKEFIDKAIAVS